MPAGDNGPMWGWHMVIPHGCRAQGDAQGVMWPGGGCSSVWGGAPPLTHRTGVCAACGAASNYCCAGVDYSVAVGVLGLGSSRVCWCTYLLWASFFPGLLGQQRVGRCIYLRVVSLLVLGRQHC